MFALNNHQRRQLDSELFRALVTTMPNGIRILMGCCRGAVGLAVALFSIEPVEATPLYTVEGYVVLGAFNRVEDSSSVNLSLDFARTTPTLAVDPSGLASSQSFAAAGRYGLRASSRATLSAFDPFHGGSDRTSAYAGAGMTLTDVVITSTTPDPPEFVQASLNLDLSGTFGVDQIVFYEGPHNTLDHIVSSGIVSVVAELDAHRFDIFTSHINVNGALGATTIAVLDGVNLALPPLTGSGHILRTPVMTVPVNEPFALRLFLGTSAGAVAELNIFNSITVLQLDTIFDFSHTLTFATNGPVFNLPEGYTVNSDSGGIIDNRWVIPEPSSFVVFLAVMFVTMCHRVAPRNPLGSPLKTDN
jgi:hypothetical protein